MERIDTSGWKSFKIGDLFEEVEVGYIDRDKEWALPLSIATKNIHDLLQQLKMIIMGLNIGANQKNINLIKISLLLFVMKTTKIMLPVAMDGNPDWNYMDRYMREMIETTSASLDILAG